MSNKEFVVRLKTYTNSSVIREKGESQNRCFKKRKHTKFFEKKIFFTPWYPLTCAYQGVRNVCFSENLMCSVLLKHQFWDSLFCLVTDEFNYTRNSINENNIVENQLRWEYLKLEIRSVILKFSKACTIKY